VAFAAAVRQEVERRKRAGRLFTYDDMLTGLRDALADPEHGPAAANRLRQRYRIVMVDEFQDTDPIQWEILHRAFHGHSTLILIGDPKQAIYAFRGADVFSYLDAVQQADQVWSLTVNRRSDQALVDALDVLLGDAALGDQRIAIRRVTAEHQQRRLIPPIDKQDVVAPVRVRVMPHQADAEKVPSVGTIRPQIVDDLVADLTALLASGAELLDAGSSRSVVPSDIAVLVRKNERGEAIRDGLVDAGVPAVMYGASSVYASPMARDWLTLLLALEQTRQQSVRQAALTCFFGWTFADLASASEESLIELTQRIRWWGKVLQSRGVAALLETATADEQIPERILSLRGGERMLTDLRHLGQSLHAAMTSAQLGVGALVEWLRARISEAHDIAVSEGTRRLETDAKAITILTVHRSKGLEFPIVYLPEAWDRYANGSDEGRILRLHEPTARHVGLTSSGECVLDVGGRHGPGRPERFSRYREEEAGEDLRLLYVALTRAQCQVVTWWAPSFNTPASALHRFASRNPTDPASPQAVYPLNGNPFGGREFGPGFSIETMTPRALTEWQPSKESPPLLRVSGFDRELDLAWSRTSYSALTAAAHGADTPMPAVSSEPDLKREDDESAATISELLAHRAVNPPSSSSLAEERTPPLAPPPYGGARFPTLAAGASPSDTALAEPSPMHDLPSGVEFGTAVHAVFERVDATAADLPAAIRQACAATLAQGPAAAMTADALAGALLPAFRTPLGPLADEQRLCDISRGDRLAELSFEYPLTGGDVTNAEVTLGMVGPLLRRHLAPSDPLNSYPDSLDDPALSMQALRGYLTGSIDAVLRIRRDNSPPRYLVVDYKTNWLGGFDGEVLKIGDYTPARMAAAMMSAHYPLQALLYAVAVHRMLRWRQPDYDPAVHLGGILYLFVRGMAGPATPRMDGVPCGVFSWRPPASLVVELSALLDGVL
jgi:exodeoxyribonuclease V beta subunit